MGPSDSRQDQDTSYVFPVPRAAITRVLTGLSGSVTDLIDTRAVLNHPGGPIDFTYSFFHRWLQASPPLEGWPPAIYVTRPKQVHVATLRLTCLCTRASTGQLPFPPPGLLHGERAISMVNTFQFTRSVRLGLTHQRNAKGNIECRLTNDDLGSGLP